MMEPQILPEQTLQADLRQYISLLWRWAWLIILAAILAGGAAYVTSRLQDPVYQATTTMLINEAPNSKASEYQAILTSERLARTYSEMLTKRPVLDDVYTRLALEDTYKSSDAIGGAISVQLVRDTQLIELRVEQTNPELAALIANAVVDVFIAQNEALQTSRFAESKVSMEEQLQRLDGQIHNTVAEIETLTKEGDREVELQRLESELVQYRQSYSNLLQSYEQIRLTEAEATSNVVQIEPARVPKNPIRPRVMMNTVMAAAVGAMLAVGAIFLMEALDDTIKSPDDITRYLGLPILGTILNHTPEDGNPIVSLTPRSPTAEAFRSLRTNIRYASVDSPIRSLLITSSSASEGKSTVAANLATVLAQGGDPTILVDADMRRPTQHQKLNLNNQFGLSSFFVFQSLFEKISQLPNGTIQNSKTEGLSVMTSGKRPPNPSELLASEKMVNLMNLIAENWDIAIIDSPPVLAVTDSTVLAPRVDGVVLVVRPGETKVEAARQAVQQLKRVGANLLGVVLNGVDPRSSRYGYYYRYEYYYDTAGGEEDGLASISKPKGFLNRLKTPWVPLTGLIALAVILGIWYITALGTGTLPLWLGGKGTFTPTPKLAAVVETVEPLVEIEAPTATRTPEPTEIVLAAESGTDTEVEAEKTQLPTGTPTVSPTPLPPTPGPGLGTPFGSDVEYVLHQVKFGDNLANLAKEYNTERDVIMAANDLVPNRSLQPDQVIVILPWKTDAFDVVPIKVLYLSQDTAIATVANENGVTEEEIRSYSDLGFDETIPGGRYLIFPKREVTPTETPTVIPTPDFSLALKGPFGPNQEYVLHKVVAGQSVPFIANLYITTPDVIRKVNGIIESIRVGDVLLIQPEVIDITTVLPFRVYQVKQEKTVEEISVDLDIFPSDLILYNDLVAEQVIRANTWLIYPVPTP